MRCPGCSRSFDVAPPPADGAADGAMDESASPGAAAQAAEGSPGTAQASGSERPAPAARPQPSHKARTLQETPRRPSISASPAGAGAAAPEEVARELLEALRAPGGEALSVSAAQGNLFAHHGPAIFEAFDEYRRRTANVGPAPFRAALRELWGVELPEVTPRP